MGLGRNEVQNVGLGRTEMGVGCIQKGLGRTEKDVGRNEYLLGRYEQELGRTELGLFRPNNTLGRYGNGAKRSWGVLAGAICHWGDMTVIPLNE